MGSMDRKERHENLEWAIRAAMEGMQADLWTSLPAKVITFDATKMTISAKPTIRGRVRSVDDNPPTTDTPAVKDKDDWWWVEMPVFDDVPVVFPNGGGFSITFPLFPGDPVTLVFSARCIDAVWQSGDIQNQAELRMHNLSDAQAFPGWRPLPLVPANVSDSNMQIRTDDGVLLIELTRDQKIRIVAPNIELGENLNQLVNKLFLQLFDNHVHVTGAPGSPTGIPTVPSDDTMVTQKVQAE